MGLMTTTRRRSWNVRWALSTTRSRKHFTRLAGALILLALSSPVVSAQALRVVVIDSTTAAPLSGVLVSLMDTAGDLIRIHRSDSRGVAWLNVPSAGQFAVLAVAPGYRNLVSGWLAVVNDDTLEVTFRLSQVARELSRVVVTAEIDSVTPLLPPGINARTLAGRVITPTEIAAHASGAGSYINVLQSTGASDFIVTTWEGHQCITSTRMMRRPSQNRPLCARVYVNNKRVDYDMALDLVTPENLDFAVWVRSIDAGVFFGSALNNEDESVLLLYTKDYRRTRMKSPR